MKILSKRIDVIAFFEREREPVPLRFRLCYDDGRSVVVKVGRISHREERKFGGIRTIVYRCQSFVSGEERVYELKYDVEDLVWYLYKF